MASLLIRVILLSSVLVLLACHASDEHQAKSSDVYTVKKKTITNRLYFSGTIQPIHSVSVTSPIAGFIQALYFHYGQTVKKGDLLFSMTSSDLGGDYYNAVIDFLKARNDEEQAFSKFTGNQLLWKNGIISRNDYLAQQRNYQETYVSFLKSRRKLEDSVQLIDEPIERVLKLTLSDKQAIWRMLHQHPYVKIHSPISGVMLMGDLKDDIGLHKGEKIDSGKVVAMVGDMSGFSVKLKVNEININSIKKGLSAIVRVPAFPNRILYGVVSTIIYQAKVSSGFEGQSALFPVVVKIKSLTPDQGRFIHVGMTAKIAISLPDVHKITVPINAISEHFGQTMVRLLDKTQSSGNKPHSRLVTVVTGRTTESDVVIESGLKEGDQILLSQ